MVDIDHLPEPLPEPGGHRFSEPPHDASACLAASQSAVLSDRHPDDVSVAVALATSVTQNPSGANIEPVRGASSTATMIGSNFGPYFGGGILKCWRCNAVLVARPTGTRKQAA